MQPYFELLPALSQRHCGQVEIPGPDLDCRLEVYALPLPNAITTALYSGNVAPGQAETNSNDKNPNALNQESFAKSYSTLCWFGF